MSVSSLALFIGLSFLGQAPGDAFVETVDGLLPAAPLVKFGDDLSVTLGGKKSRTIPGREMVSIRLAGIPGPALCPPPYLQLTSGDRLPIVTPINARLADEVLKVTLGGGLIAEFLPVPQAMIAALVLAPGEVAREKGGADVVVLLGGDRLAGKIVSIQPATGVRLDVAGEVRAIPLDRIAHIWFDSDFQVQPKMTGPYADVMLRGGARLFATQIVSSENRLTAVTQLKEKIDFPASALASIRQRGRGVVYVDERKPKAFEATPFLDAPWPLAVGHSALGGPLKLGDDFYPLGLGVHSRSRVTYSIEPTDQRFEAIVGVDPAAGASAAVAIDVELDGKAAPNVARLMTAESAPALLRIDVRGAKTITLITDFGPRGGVQGHAIWADARFIQK